LSISECKEMLWNVKVIHCKGNQWVIIICSKFDCSKNLSSSCHFFCHLLESSLARINWIRAVDKFCVEQLISCQNGWANDCRAIEFRAVDPHSNQSNVRVFRFWVMLELNAKLHYFKAIKYINFMQWLSTL
jgi:hypothetical protein